jgi:hypothetical protein
MQLSNGSIQTDGFSASAQLQSLLECHFQRQTCTNKALRQSKRFCGRAETQQACSTTRAATAFGDGNFSQAFWV